MKKLAIATVALVSAIAISAFKQDRAALKNSDRDIAQKAISIQNNTKDTAFAARISGERANLAQADYGSN